eukprot:GHVN01019432.1.p1 GENE.GHVN01019432.1~~GHVN01019432.1.p1  ORF type:complete len:929 (+),score=180.03 GHVN01019432.1:2291-5077(+)
MRKCLNFSFFYLLHFLALLKGGQGSKRGTSGRSPQLRNVKRWFMLYGAPLHIGPAAWCGGGHHEGYLTIAVPFKKQRRNRNRGPGKETRELFVKTPPSSPSRIAPFLSPSALPLSPSSNPSSHTIGDLHHRNHTEPVSVADQGVRTTVARGFFTPPSGRRSVDAWMATIPLSNVDDLAATERMVYFQHRFAPSDDESAFSSYRSQDTRFLPPGDVIASCACRKAELSLAVSQSGTLNASAHGLPHSLPPISSSSSSFCSPTARWASNTNAQYLSVDDMAITAVTSSETLSEPPTLSPVHLPNWASAERGCFQAGKPQANFVPLSNSSRYSPRCEQSIQSPHALDPPYHTETIAPIEVNHMAGGYLLSTSVIVGRESDVSVTTSEDDRYVFTSFLKQPACVVGMECEGAFVWPWRCEAQTSGGKREPREVAWRGAGELPECDGSEGSEDGCSFRFIENGCPSAQHLKFKVHGYRSSSSKRNPLGMRTGSLTFSVEAFTSSEMEKEKRRSVSDIVAGVVKPFTVRCEMRVIDTPPDSEYGLCEDHNEVNEDRGDWSAKDLTDDKEQQSINGYHRNTKYSHKPAKRDSSQSHRSRHSLRSPRPRENSHFTHRSPTSLIRHLFTSIAPISGRGNHVRMDDAQTRPAGSPDFSSRNKRSPNWADHTFSMNKALNEEEKRRRTELETKMRAIEKKMTEIDEQIVSGGRQSLPGGGVFGEGNGDDILSKEQQIANRLASLQRAAALNSNLPAFAAANDWNVDSGVSWEAGTGTEITGGTMSRASSAATRTSPLSSVGRTGTQSTNDNNSAVGLESVIPIDAVKSTETLSLDIDKPLSRYTRLSDQTIQQANNFISYDNWAVNWGRDDVTRSTRVQAGNDFGFFGAGYGIERKNAQLFTGWRDALFELTADQTDESVGVGFIKGNYGVKVRKVESN